MYFTERACISSQIGDFPYKEPSSCIHAHNEIPKAQQMHNFALMYTPFRNLLPQQGKRNVRDPSVILGSGHNLNECDCMDASTKPERKSTVPET
jgi:hypothetical protein